VTFFIVLEAHEHPSFRTLRLLGVGLIAAACLIFGIRLLVRIIGHKLQADATSHSEYREDRQPKKGLARYLARVRSLETLTPYLTVSFIGRAVTIVAAVGL
jgi:hypothetical protein